MGALNVNKVFIGGRLVRDPVISEGDKMYARFLIAINGKSVTDFIEIFAYDDLAEQIVDNCRTGSTVFVEARLQYIKDLGKIRVIAKLVQFLKEAHNGVKEETSAA